MNAAFGGAFAGRRVLVTGHTGFKGAWLSWWLRRLGASVAGIALPEPPSDPNLFDALGLADVVQDLRFDLADAGQAAEAIGGFGPQVVFHLAAQALVRRGYTHPLQTVQSNVLATANVLEAVRATKSVGAAVVASTDKSYRNDERGRPFRETDPLQGNDPYSATKASADMVASAWALLPGMPPVAIVRSGNVVGGGDWGEDRLVPDLVRACATGESAAVRHPDSVRPWQDVRDCLAGYLRVAQQLLAGEEESGAAYNFGSSPDDRLTVAEVADVVVDAYGQGGWHAATGSASAAEAVLLLLDSGRARERLGWRPVWPALEAIRHASGWYREFSAGANARDLCDAALDAYERRAAEERLPWAQTVSAALKD